MLKQLHISNYALIDQLDIGFNDGLTIITGETGAGKSIILGALSLILGERADTKAIRDTSRKTIVEATFNISGYHLEDFFKVNDIDWDERECITRRELSPSGRSRSFVNDTPVALSLLRELSTHLLDIHSQHSNMLLSQPSFQLSILDNMAGNGELLNNYRAAYQDYREAVKRLDDTRQEIERLRHNEDYIRYQLDQLQEMQLKPNEDEELEAQQRKLSNVTGLKDAMWNVINLLDSEDDSTLQRLSTVAQRLEEAGQSIDDMRGMAERARNAIVELKDIAQSTQAIMESLNDDPAELDRVENRLSQIFSLQHKHNASGVNELIEMQHDFERQLHEIEYNNDIIEELKAQVEACQTIALNIAAQLSANRHTASKRFGKELMALAVPLGMRNIAFDVDFNTTALSPTGTDAVEFMMAFNKNQRPMPVKETASGGEISRVMLCIKAIIARHMRLPSIIFDEVDTGVSGDVANMIGEMMADIARSIQVISITHLPQVAAHGNHHLRVYKTDNDVETLTHVESLSDEEHVLEIARMLSGKGLNQAAIDNAKTLIKHNKKNNNHD